MRAVLKHYSCYMVSGSTPLLDERSIPSAPCALQHQNPLRVRIDSGCEALCLLAWHMSMVAGLSRWNGSWLRHWFHLTQHPVAYVNGQHLHRCILNSFFPSTRKPSKARAVDGPTRHAHVICRRSRAAVATKQRV